LIRGWSIGQEKLRVGNDELFLRDVVQPLLLQDEVVAEAVVENSKAARSTVFGDFLPLPSRPQATPMRGA